MGIVSRRQENSNLYGRSQIFRGHPMRVSPKSAVEDTRIGCPLRTLSSQGCGAAVWALDKNAGIPYGPFGPLG